jgi:hypothetical protein
MARVLSDAELDSIEVITTMGSTWTNVLHSIREARRERDAARAALRWLAGECYQEPLSARCPRHTLSLRALPRRCVEECRRGAGGIDALG